MTSIHPQADEPVRLGRAARVRWGLVALACTAIGAIGSLAGASVVSSSDTQQARVTFHASTGAVAASLRTAIEHEEDLVVSASAYITEHPRISPAGFNRWAGSVHAFARFPELQNLGFVQLVPAQALPRFAAALAANPVLAFPGAPSTAKQQLQILPAGERPYYCLATAGLARSAGSYIPAGADYCAFAPALFPSRAAGHSSYAPFALGAGAKTLGVETPVYRTGNVPSTVAAREKSFLGWLGELLTPGEVIARALEGYPHIAVQLTYSRGGEHATFATGTAPHGAQRATVKLQNGWSVLALAAKPQAGLLANLNSALILLGGLALSGLMSILIFVLGTSRRRAMALVEQKTRELSHQALHDNLTGLPNRALILDRARIMLARCRRAPDLRAGVLFIDIDGFKQVNDEHGHESGDRLLQTVAGRLSACTRSHDTVGRLGGDEFIVLAEAENESDALQRIAERILESLQEPVLLPDGAEIPLTVSIGIARGHYETAEGLLGDADKALYRAKAAGKNTHATHSPEPAALHD